jgi:hypothetical protein
MSDRLTTAAGALVVGALWVWLGWKMGLELCR